MELSKYDGKHVRVTDKWGETFTGIYHLKGFFNREMMT